MDLGVLGLALHVVDTIHFTVCKTDRQLLEVSFDHGYSTVTVEFMANRREAVSLLSEYSPHSSLGTLM